MMYCIVYYLPFAIVVFAMRCFLLFLILLLSYVCIQLLLTCTTMKKPTINITPNPLLKLLKTLLLHGIVISVYELRHYHKNTLCLIWSQHFLLSSFFIQLIGNQNSISEFSVNSGWPQLADNSWKGLKFLIFSGLYAN